MKYMLCTGAHAYLASEADGHGTLESPHDATPTDYTSKKIWFVTQRPFFFSSEDITKNTYNRMVVKLPVLAGHPQLYLTTYIVFNIGDQYEDDGDDSLTCITGRTE